MSDNSVGTSVCGLFQWVEMLGGSTQQEMGFDLVGGLPTPLADLHANSMGVRERGRGGCVALEPMDGS